MGNQANYALAPALDTVGWLNCTKPLTLEKLRGEVVVIHAFQMLCPGCVVHGIPQASAIAELYRQQNVQVIGLHTVFEHHDVMTRDALTAFVHEYKVSFPVAIDRPSETDSIPHTMALYQMQGTPTLIIVDKNGYVRLNHFGQMSDMQVGNIIGHLLEEKSSPVAHFDEPKSILDVATPECDDDGCSV